MELLGATGLARPYTGEVLDTPLPTAARQLLIVERKPRQWFEDLDQGIDHDYLLDFQAFDRVEELFRHVRGLDVIQHRLDIPTPSPSTADRGDLLVGLERQLDLDRDRQWRWFSGGTRWPDDNVGNVGSHLAMTADLNAGQSPFLCALIELQHTLSDDAVVRIATFQCGYHAGTGNHVPGFPDIDTGGT